MGLHKGNGHTIFFIILVNYTTDISLHAGYMSAYGWENRLIPQCISLKCNTYIMIGQCKKYDSLRFQPFESSTIFLVESQCSSCHSTKNLPCETTLAISFKTALTTYLNDLPEWDEATCEQNVTNKSTNSLPKLTGETSQGGNQHRGK